MYRFLIIFTFFCSNSCNIYNGSFSNYDSKQKEIADSNIVLKGNNQTIKTKSDDDEQLQIINSNEARGLDSLVGMKKDQAMPILSKYHFTEISGHHYPYIKQVLKIENFNKWSHPSTLYIFVDSSNRVCKLNYFFKEVLSNEVSEKFKNNLFESLEETEENIPSAPKGTMYEDNPNPRKINHLLIIDSIICINWEDRNCSRRLFHLSKGRILYSVMSIAYMNSKAHDLKALQDNILEPILKQGK